MDQIGGRVQFASALLALSFLGGSAWADESEFLNRFKSSWRGGGTVLRDADKAAQRLTVYCSAAPKPVSDTEMIDVGGSCRAALVFSRAFEAAISFDPATGLYTGTYVGSNAASARLVGRRAGDTVNFTVHWNKEVNGDDVATLAVRNDGQTLAIRLIDRLGPSGPRMTTTDLIFSRR